MHININRCYLGNTYLCGGNLCNIFFVFYFGSSIFIILFNEHVLQVFLSNLIIIIYKWNIP